MKYVNLHNAKWNKIGLWSPSDGFESVDKEIFFLGGPKSVSDFVSSMHGTHVFACLIVDPDVDGFQTIWRNGRPSNFSNIAPEMVGGMQDGFFKALAASIGFNFTYRYPRDEKLGSKNFITGEYNGILKELESKVKY